MKRGRKILVAGLVVVAAVGLGVKSCRDSICGYDPQAEMAIPGTKWVAKARAFRCWSVGGTSDVIAEDSETGKELPIISFWTTESIQLRADTPYRLTVTLDNEVDIKEMHDSFEGIAIVYEYQPANDPEGRAFYEFRRRHWDDPELKSDPRMKKFLPPDAAPTN
jgi:hypothetical protein